MDFLNCIRIYLYSGPFIEIHHIGLYLLCVTFTIDHLEHVISINGSLVLHISICSGGKGFSI